MVIWMDIVGQMPMESSIDRFPELVFTLCFFRKAVDLFDMKEGFRTMEESLARVTMPCLVSHLRRLLK